MAESQASTLEQARAAKPQALALFELLATVVGIGITRIGTGYGLKVNLQKQPTNPSSLPTEVAGVPVKIEIVGSIRK